MAVKKIKSTSKTDFSNEYYCIHSIQKLNSEFDTNVLASNIPVDQLLKNRDVLLVDDLRGDSRWGMNKVIQRNISFKRVEEIKKEYLEAKNRLIKFFPAITVVLLPKTNGEPKQFFEYSENDFDSIKGIQIEKIYEDEDDNYIFDFPVQLKWDKNEISALVIDGQHRVSALRSFYEGKNEQSYENVSIPVSFVIFKNDKDIDLIQATRALFIDVNNTPRLVSEEKLIFIDDRNIHRRISAKSLGANDPGDNKIDVYQKMLLEEDFLLNEDSFINRYLIEESGKDDEDNRGFLSNHKTLFPWEISNIMTIHRNILGGILLRYKDIDKSRDIRSICNILNSSILDEIEKTESVEELSSDKVDRLIVRLKTSGLSDNEIDVFKILIILKQRNLEEIQQAQGEFLIGTAAEPDEEQDNKYFISLLQNIYNQDCSKDSAFELSSNKVSELLKENCSNYIKLLVCVFNELWFVKQIKESILKYEGKDRQLIFNFILATHESLRIEDNIRHRADKIEKQINVFFKENDNTPRDRIAIVKVWANKLYEVQNTNLLRTIVGQEMLFIYIIEQDIKLHLKDLQLNISFINSLGEINFFNNSYKLELNFVDEVEFKITDFNPWSEIIMKGDSMKPGITNANKGADFIYFVQNKMTNRINALSQLRKLDRLQKSYGIEIVEKITSGDTLKLFKMYSKVKKIKNLQDYLTASEIQLVSEKFKNGDILPTRVQSVISKLYGALGLEQIVNHFNDKLKV